MLNILHIGSASFFTENMNYQDNLLSEQNLKDGHKVTYIANCEAYVEGVIQQVGCSDKIISNGLRLIRMPFTFVLNTFISSKFRKISRLYEQIKKINPDTILFHGCCAWDLMTVAKYKKKHPNTKLYVDSHEDFNNSATNWVSKNILHRLFYRPIIRKAYKYIDKIFYISLECKDLLTELYGLAEEKMEFYPLGGKIIAEDERKTIRAKKRKELEVDEKDILLIHSGKMDKLKRTQEILTAFSKVNDERMKLVLLGSIPDDLKESITKLIDSDCRVKYLGWVNANQLTEYLCACDLYLQPGSQSATMQNAMCCGCAIMLYPHNSHQPFLNDNGWYVETQDDMVNVFLEVSRDPEMLIFMKNKSLKIANEMLDYKKLAAKLYE